MRAPSHLCARSRWSSLWSRWRRRAVLRCWLLIVFARPWPCCRRSLRPSRPRRQDRGHHRHQGKDHGRFYAPVHHQGGGRVLRHDRLGEYRRWYRVLREHQHHARGPRGLAPYRQLPHVRSPVHGHGGLEPGAQVPTRRESAFDVACFLNIGRDHISPIEHPTFEDYFESKLRIFDQAKTAVVNLGTDEVDRVLEAASTAERLVTVGVEHPEASLWASDVRMLGFNIEFNLHGMSADEPRRGRRSCWVSRATLTWKRAGRYRRCARDRHRYRGYQEGPLQTACAGPHGGRGVEGRPRDLRR